MHTGCPIRPQQQPLRVAGGCHAAAALADGLTSHNDVQLIHMITLCDDVHLQANQYLVALLSTNNMLPCALMKLAT